MEEDWDELIEEEEIADELTEEEIEEINNRRLLYEARYHPNQTRLDHFVD